LGPQNKSTLDELERRLGTTRCGEGITDADRCLRWTGQSCRRLVESATPIRKAIPKGNKTYQADPGNRDKSEFFRALALEPSAFIQAGGCDFMDALSRRLLVAQPQNLKSQRMRWFNASVERSLDTARMSACAARRAIAITGESRLGAGYRFRTSF